MVSFVGTLVVAVEWDALLKSLIPFEMCSSSSSGSGGSNDSSSGGSSRGGGSFGGCGCE